MRWTAKQYQPRNVWHKWFAWHPVTVGDQRVWLETVERRGEWCGEGVYGDMLWEYREPVE